MNSFGEHNELAAVVNKKRKFDEVHSSIIPSKLLLIFFPGDLPISD
jgi:hypothetical protein